MCSALLGLSPKCSWCAHSSSLVIFLLSSFNSLIPEFERNVRAEYLCDSFGPISHHCGTSIWRNHCSCLPPPPPPPRLPRMINCHVLLLPQSISLMKSYVRLKDQPVQPRCHNQRPAVIIRAKQAANRLPRKKQQNRVHHLTRRCRRGGQIRDYPGGHAAPFPVHSSSSLSELGS